MVHLLRHEGEPLGDLHAIRACPDGLDPAHLGATGLRIKGVDVRESPAQVEKDNALRPGARWRPGGPQRPEARQQTHAQKRFDEALDKRAAGQVGDDRFHGGENLGLALEEKLGRIQQRPNRVLHRS